MKRKTIYYIVLNDFRALPYSAAIDIYKRNKCKGRSVKIILSERYFSSDDYGSHLPRFYKKAKFWWLQLQYDVILTSANKSTKLTIQEESGVNSSLQSITFDSSASESSYPKLYETLRQSSIGAKEVKEFIFLTADEKSKVYVFNGRTAGSYPIVRGCFDKSIEVEFYEYSENFRGYKLFPCAPHNTSQLGRAVSRFRKICLVSAPSLNDRACSWARRRLSNPYTNLYRESPDQTFDVVVFLGSDHEYTCLDEDITGCRYIGNYEMVRLVIEKYGKNLNVAVRCHPNQYLDKNHRKVLESVELLCQENDVTFYPPNSEISSYDLIRNSVITAVEFSSIAYDAVLLGKKVELYNDLDLKYFLQSITLDQANNAEYVAHYVSELMCLYTDLYFERFELLTRATCSFWTHVEWKLLKANNPKCLS